MFLVMVEVESTSIVVSSPVSLFIWDYWLNISLFLVIVFKRIPAFVVVSSFVREVPYMEPEMIKLIIHDFTPPFSMFFSS